MNTCIKCGVQIAEGELFCPRCSLNPYDFTDVPTPQPEPPVGRMTAPVKLPKKAPEPESKPVRSYHGRFIVCLIGLILALGACGLLLYNQYSTRVALLLREEAVAARESELAQLSEENAELTEQLAQAQNDISTKEEQIETLRANVNTAESSANQAQFDMNLELDKLQKELDEQQKQQTELQEKYDALLLSSAADMQAAKFMQDYVVFVENDGSGLFHRYGCDRFACRTFWAYSRRLAENSGYSPCPYCMK